MATMTLVDEQFLLVHTISGAGNEGAILSTQNKFVDKNIGINIYTPAATSPLLSITDKTSELLMGDATNGTYYPTVDLDGALSFGTAGFISTSSVTVVDHTVSIGKVPQSTLSTTSVVPGVTTQTVTISKGYYPENRTVTISAISDLSTTAGVTSGTASLGVLEFTYDDNHFDVIGLASIAAPTVTTAGYIAPGAETLSATSNTVTQTVNQIGLDVNISGGAAITPTITTSVIGISGVLDATNGSATTVAPSSGVYVKVKSNASNSTVSAAATVTTAGYGTTAHFNAENATITTVNINQSEDTYIPIKSGELSAVDNEPNSSFTANTVTVLSSGGWLQIAEVYPPATKISLATLVPDGTDIKGHADYILSGHSALDEDGLVVTGSIPTYDGLYDLTSPT